MAHLLARQYELITPIGRGPTGEVWRATDLNTRDSVAVKMLDSRLSHDGATVDRFVRERQVLTAFLHPSYVRVRDLIAGDGLVALVMEFVTGWDLRRHVGHSAGLQPAMAAEIGLSLAGALAAAHRAGVVHCDLKPSNVLLEEPTGEPRLTDCRVARLAHGYNGPAAWYTSPEYAAPEVIRGGPPVPATDVYALGLVLYEMLTGVPPYYGGDPDAILAGHLRGDAMIPPSVPPHLAELIAECLNPDPSARPSADDMSQRLRYVESSTARDVAWGQIVAPPPSASIGQPDPAPVRSWAIDRLPGAGRGSLVGPVGHVGPVGPPRPAGRGRRVTVLIGLLVFSILGTVAAVLLASSGGESPAANRPGATQPATVASSAGAPTPAGSAGPETQEGATAYAHHWFEALTYAVGTGDISALQAASSPQCQACSDAITVIRDGHRSGSSLRGGAYSVRTVTADDFWTIERPNLRIVFDRSPRSAVGAAGEITEVFPGGSFLTCQVLLERADGKWRILAVLSPEPIV